MDLSPGSLTDPTIFSSGTILIAPTLTNAWGYNKSGRTNITHLRKEDSLQLAHFKGLALWERGFLLDLGSIGITLVSLLQGENMAELNISERQAGDVTILDLEGKVTIGEGSVALRSAVRNLIAEGRTKVLLNLASVSYCDSSGIGELVSSFSSIQREGGSMKLLNLTKKLQDLLSITKLLTVFDDFDNEEEALASFN